MKTKAAIQFEPIVDVVDAARHRVVLVPQDNNCCEKMLRLRLLGQREHVVKLVE
jgi:hypothetical protein